MGKHHIRENNICENCGFTVENRYCSNCSQENTETRQSFGYVVKHFFEDFTHYDNAFWKTMKYLLFYPAKLTKEYLSGKRMSFVPPVKLYIFISFVTFLLPKLLPEINTFETTSNQITIQKDSLPIKKKVMIKVLDGKKYSSLQEFDSIQETLPENERTTGLAYDFTKKIFEFKKKSSNETLIEKAVNSFFDNLPKLIFLYMPIFCFSLWLFHNKKKWLLFDHAIFTLHYFGFMLLAITISITIFENLLSHILSKPVYDQISPLNAFILLGWIITYFFMAHKRIYQEKNIVSFTKSAFLFFMNLLFAFSLTIAGILYILFNTN